ncbi:hypothetical protein, partial [Streptomyces sp. SID5770]|uniref:hypothetical protein n=1 Tax=Streptomyces sp. SID5770 TaxID=2690308 RepID=UPI001F192C40
MDQMVTRAATPLFVEIDEALHDYAVLTNFSNGAHAGEIISRRELASGQTARRVFRSTGCPANLIIQAIDGYFHAMSTRSVEKWVSLFDSRHGRMIDAGSRPFVGHSRLRVFIESLFVNFPEISAS